MKKSILSLFSVCCAISTVFGQVDTTSKSNSQNTTSFTGYMDGYYRYDFAGLKENNKTSFTNSHNQFQLGMVSFKVDQTLGKFAGTLDLGVGKRAEEFSYNENGLAADVKQAYISYAPTSKVKFTVGKWATHVGYELVDAYSNKNYSMSYGFSYGPFFHTGVKADISLGGKSALMVGVAEPTDVTSSKVEARMVVAQFSTATKDDKLKAYLNYQGGMDKTQFDLVLNGVVTSKFGINYDGTICRIAEASWTSNALYFNYDYSSKIGFTLRSEYFDDSKTVAGVGASILQNTFSMNVHFKKLTIIPEIRIENASDKIFLTNVQAASGNAGSFLVAAVYKF
jgi:hypothetical protein